MIRRASARRSSGTIEMPVSSFAMPMTAAPCFLTSGRIRSMRSSSAVTEFTSALPSYAASGAPAWKSSMCAPAATCACASARTRSITPSFISAARTLRPVGLMRSPMTTNGRSPEITTSRLREERRVSQDLSLAERLVDLHHRLLQRLRAGRALTSIADELFGHAGGHRRVGRVAVGADVLRVLLGDGCAADRDMHLISETRLGQGVDVGLEHRHGRRQEGRETHDVGLVLLHGLDELLGRGVDAQVEDLEPGALEHDHAEVFADVVDVALHRADDVAANRLGARLRDQGTEDDQRALHGPGGDQHLGDEEVALLEAAPNLLQGGDEGLEQDVHRAHAEGQAFLGQGLDLRGVAVEGVLEKAGADLLFSAHSVLRRASYVALSLRAKIMG